MKDEKKRENEKNFPNMLFVFNLFIIFAGKSEIN